MKRRQFLAGSLASGAGLLLSPRLPDAEAAGDRTTTPTSQGVKRMAFQQPELPYALGALKPFLSEEQMSYHYGKHHAAYFKKLNTLLEGKPEAQLSLEEVIIKSEGPVFNNAGQAWNHTFFWNCMSPGGGGEPQGPLAQAIAAAFGSFQDFRKKFSDTAVNLFGSGWAWLAADQSGKLEILPLGNAGTPLKLGKRAVLTVDVWEHAYYIDYRNERPKFVDGFWSRVNWEFASRCFANATK